MLFEFWVAETIYDCKSQAPQFAYDCQSMALGDDESTPRAIDFPIIGSFGAYDFLNACIFLKIVVAFKFHGQGNLQAVTVFGGDGDF